MDKAGASVASSQELQDASGLDCRVLLFKKGGSTSTRAGGKAITGGGLGSSSLLSSLSSLNSSLVKDYLEVFIPLIALHVGSVSALTTVTTALTLNITARVEIHLDEVLTWTEAPHRWRGIDQLVL